MSLEEANEIIFEAAGDWLNELVDYIIPEAGVDSVKGYVYRAEQIQQAMTMVEAAKLRD